MKKRQDNSTRASALQITLSLALMALSAILFASSFRAAPQAASDSFYPPLPAQQSAFSPPLPAAPDGVPLITVALPVSAMDPSVPASTIIVLPVTTTLIDPTTTTGFNLIGFQGDFLFDSAVISFPTSQACVAAGLTTAVPWTVNSNVINTGPGTFKTLRVSAFVGDGSTGLNGCGTLYNLRMFRVSSNPGDTTAMTWAPSSTGNQFLFIDDQLNSYTPNQTNGNITIDGAGVT